MTIASSLSGRMLTLAAAVACWVASADSGAQNTAPPPAAPAAPARLVYLAAPVPVPAPATPRACYLLPARAVLGTLG